MVSLVCCVVVLFFVVVSFFLFSAGSLSLWFGWGRCAYNMLGEGKSLVNLDLILLVLFLLCFVLIRQHCSAVYVGMVVVVCIP